MRQARQFQSTPPVKAATLSVSALFDAPGFQSTPPVKAATARYAAPLPNCTISIHAAREGGDACPQHIACYIGRISIHAAREGGDAPDSMKQSLRKYISIHAAREGGDRNG